MLSAVWALGSVATLGLLGMLIADVPTHGTPAPVSQPDAESFEPAAFPVGAHVNHLVTQPDRTGLGGEGR
ncbi:hypothetical protein MOV08_19615 [Streptomyces yunnanensis]|uniref:Secreted protein n=1 Tax=Streptomyces yunnanensis TaxID=156453 RepID=A0ABY8A900_9ACTN|nr:hypothetical protein [Streptomyces yunnanensis]WEB41268.1 hypothetical protein MOV08_19615 [Streptomyces yunnanensis]